MLNICLLYTSDAADYDAVVKPGRIIFEISGVPEDVAREAIRKAGHKLPMKTKFVKRDTL